MPLTFESTMTRIEFECRWSWANAAGAFVHTNYREQRKIDPAHAWQDYRYYCGVWTELYNRTMREYSIFLR